MKTQTIFTCSHCDAQYQKWIGRCLECGKWGSIDQNPTTNIQISDKKNTYAPAKTKHLAEINQEKVARLKTNIEELDRVLGGGIVPGSLILLSGEPGIGKSTLTLQLANSISPTFYASGEESLHQIKSRADRLGTHNDKLLLSSETQLEPIIATIEKEKPKLAIIDSIQTISSIETSGETGNLTQIRACTTKLLGVAKKTNTAICIIGQVTKDGGIAGPKTLEHLVDTVMHLEGDRYHNYRILRTIKNRFGATDEVGIFEMTETGLTEVSNPSANFLAERSEDLSGSVLTCLMEGSRPLLIEVQALVNKTHFGYPVRKSSGFDLNRLHVLAAVLQKRTGLSLGEYDIHINIVGGIKAHEPAVDLAVCVAIASSYKDKALGNSLVVFGEVGLGGEIRKVAHTKQRIKECAKLGMKHLISAPIKEKISTDIKIVEMKNINEIIKHT